MSGLGDAGFDAFAGLGLLLQAGPVSCLVAFCWGALWGSFLNVVVYRMPLMRSVVFPPSACGSCGEPLSPLENIPILSCLWQGARCRRCGSTFSWRYMAMELWMASWSAFLAQRDDGMGWLWLYHFALVFLATAVFLTDWDHWIIPDEVNLAGGIAGILLSIPLASRHDLSGLSGLLGPLHSNVWSSLLGAGFGWLFFSAVQLFGLLIAKQEAMGGGDVKYAAALGAFLGWYGALQAFLLSFLLGAAIAVPMMVLARGSGKEPIPFGTFMSIAAVVVALWGGGLMTLYDRFFFQFSGFYPGG